MHGDRGSARRTQPTKDTCKFWRRGCCAKGSACRFVHGGAEPELDPPNRQNMGTQQPVLLGSKARYGFSLMDWSTSSVPIPDSWHGTTTKTTTPMAMTTTKMARTTATTDFQAIAALPSPPPPAHPARPLPAAIPAAPRPGHRHPPALGVSLQVPIPDSQRGTTTRTTTPTATTTTRTARRSAAASSATPAATATDFQAMAAVPLPPPPPPARPPRPLPRPPVVLAAPPRQHRHPPALGVVPNPTIVLRAPPTIAMDRRWCDVGDDEDEEDSVWQYYSLNI